MTPVAVLPEIRLEIAGAPLTRAHAAAIAAITVREELSSPTMCEVTFSLQAEAPAVTTGVQLELWAAGRPAPLFSGEITAIEHCEGGQREMHVRAYDSLCRLRRRQAMRVHTEVTVADIAREMLAGSGCTVEVGENSWPLWRRIIQYAQTDFDFLATLALRCGAYFHLRGIALHLLTLAGMGEARTLRLGRELLRASVEDNIRDACSAVHAQAWAPANVSWYDASAGGEGSELERFLPALLSDGPDHLSAFAAAEAARCTASRRVLRALAEGDPDLHPGSKVDLDDVAPSLAGSYVVTWVHHRLDRQGGFTTEFGTDPPRRRVPPDNLFATPAVVTRIDDPDGLGRVCASLPAIGNLETDWLCVLAAGAGAGKGFMATPDTGDQVLALVSAANPATGLVLGSLYGGQGMPDTGIESGAVKRFTMLTPGSQKLVLDDARGQVRVQNQAGSFFEMLPSGATLSAAGDMAIRAPGKRIVIEAAEIEFRRR